MIERRSLIGAMLAAPLAMTLPKISMASHSPVGPIQRLTEYTKANDHIRMLDIHFPKEQCRTNLPLLYENAETTRLDMVVLVGLFGIRPGLSSLQPTGVVMLDSSFPGEKLLARAVDLAIHRWEDRKYGIVLIAKDGKNYRELGPSYFIR